MTSRNFDDYDWSNPHENYRYERESAIEMVPGADPDDLMFALEMAWMRGHNAGANLGWSEHGNVFKRPPAEQTTYTDEYKKLIWPFIKEKVDSEEEEG
jgi:hypothetical protein